MATRNAIPIRLFIITPYPYVLWTLERLIESNQPKMERAGSASTCVEALQTIDGTTIDIIVLDADVGREQCIASISKLKTSSGSKVLVLTGLRDESLHGDAALAGASGVVKTESPARTILLAINKVYEGQLWLDRAIASRIFHQKIRERSAEAPDSDRARIAILTKRERELLALATRHTSANVKILGRMLNISENTARNRLTSIYKKLDVSGRLGMTALEYNHGLTTDLPDL